jgi:transcriptional regulator with PAS, ATPase and Fis domain
LIRLGVRDVLELPAASSRIAEAAAKALADVGQQAADDHVVGRSPRMQLLRRRIESAARVPSTVLIRGETGTGKGLVARAIHARSTRRDEPFVHVDCAALSPTLIESELFGHERGAFTGAHSQRKGRFELAALGTVFLDEVGELSPVLQAKLLRLLEDKMYERVGGTTTLPLRARVIAATNRDLRRAVESGEFRRDLYFRLNVLRIEVPALREHPSDIPELVEFAVRRLSASLGMHAPLIGADVSESLGAHGWPGNVRELFNLVERALVEEPHGILESQTLLSLLDSGWENATTPTNEPATAEEIAAALAASGGNVARTARRLGLARGTLRYRIRKHGLTHLIPDD